MLSRKEGFSKAFSRVKQRVDQNLGRAEATRPLSDDSVEAERRIGNVQKAMERFSKAAKEYTDHCAKPPEEVLVKSFQKNGETLGQIRDLGDIWLGAANVEKQLASERENLQSIIKSTMDDKCRHVEEQLANVRRMRKDLDNYILDMDAARRRYQQLMRQQGSYNNSGQLSYGNADSSWTSSSTSPPPPPDFSAEVASAWQKVESARDTLEAEMNEIIAHEYEYGEVVVHFLEQQAAFHERSFRILKSVIPSLRERLDDSINRPVFGLALSDHLRLWHRRVALVIEYCCLHLLKFGKTEEGLFRIAAGASKIRRLKARFNSGQFNTYPWPPVMPPQPHDISSMTDSTATGQGSMSSSPEFNLPPTDPNEVSEFDVHALAGVLKQYLRELPEPLLTSALCEEWTQAAILPEDDRLVVVQALLSRLPPEYYENLRYLVHFLSLLTQYADQNRMTPANVGIVIGPSIMPSSAARVAENAAAVGSLGASFQLTQPAIILQTFIENVDLLFPGRTAFKPETCSVAIQPQLAYFNNRDHINHNYHSNSGSASPKMGPNGTTLSASNNYEVARRYSNCESFESEDQTVPNGASNALEQMETCDQQRRWSGVPSSGAFLTDKKAGGRSQPCNENADREGPVKPQKYLAVKQTNGSSNSVNHNIKPSKKSLAPPVPGSLGSPRVVKAILSTFSNRSSRDISSDASKLEEKLRNRLPNECSTPTAVAAARRLSDIEATTKVVTSISEISDNDTVAVLDTSSMKRNRGEIKETVRADAAFQRVIRAEVRRMKSKEMRNKFFAGETTQSDSTTRHSLAASGDLSENGSIHVPTLPKSVLVFPPVGRDSNEVVDQTSLQSFYSSTPSVAAADNVAGSLKLPLSASVANSRRGSMPGSYSRPLTSTATTNASADAPAVKLSSGKTGLYKRNRDLLRRVSTLDKFESSDVPEQVGSQPDHTVPRPAVPPPPVPQASQQPVLMSSLASKAGVEVVRTPSSASTSSATLLHAYNKSDSDYANAENSKRQQQTPRDTTQPAGTVPVLPRRRAPIAPPQMPPPPPPPSSPPASLVPTYQNVTPPLIPSHVGASRPNAGAKIAGVPQTSPTSSGRYAFDNSINNGKNNETASTADAEPRDSEMFITSL